MCEGEGDSEGRTLAPVCQKSPPLRGGWHGGAVTGEFKSKKVIFIRCFTPSVTAFGGDSSLKEGALEDGREFFDKLKRALYGARFPILQTGRQAFLFPLPLCQYQFFLYHISIFIQFILPHFPQRVCNNTAPAPLDQCRLPLLDGASGVLTDPFAFTEAYKL